MEDADFLRLKELEPQLLFSLPASMIHEDLTNVTLTTDLPDPALAKSIHKAPSPIAHQEPRSTHILHTSYPQVSYSNTHCSTQAKVAPTISENCQIFEESDLHWDICSPEKHILTQTKCMVMVDQGTDTADLPHPALSPPSSEEKNKTDVYKQIDDIIDLLSEFSPSISGSSFGKSKREELTVSGLSLSPSTSSALPPVAEDTKKGVFDAIDEVVDKFANSCHVHNSMCMMSRIEGDPLDPNHSILDIHPDMDTPSSSDPLFSHLPENQPSALEIASNVGDIYSPSASPPSSPFEPDEILSRCTFAMDSKMSPAELLDHSGESEELVPDKADGGMEIEDHEKEESLHILIENPVLSPVTNNARTPSSSTPRCSVHKTPLGSSKHKQPSFDSSEANAADVTDVANVVDKENFPNENVEAPHILPISQHNETMSESKTIENSETLNYSTMSSSAANSSAFIGSGLQSNPALYASFFSADHSFSFYNISSSTIAEEDPEVSEEAELSNMEELEDRKLASEHIMPSRVSPLVIKVRESPVTISQQRSQKVEAVAIQQRDLAEKLCRITKLRALSIFLVLLLAVLLCGTIVLRDVYRAIKTEKQTLDTITHHTYNVSYTVNNYEAPSCYYEDVTLMTVLSASAKPLAKRTSGALLAFQVFLASSPTKDVVIEAAKKLWNMVKFSTKGLIRVVTLMPQKHSDLLMSW
ncbi:hypothetical protein EON65_05825 [archaeon]|nr:MAG: hypothetical protein EON65_05825 [archaeon]